MREIEESGQDHTRAPGKPWNLSEFSDFIGTSRRHVERLVVAGKIRTINIGHRKFVPDEEAQRVFREGC